MKHSSIFTPFFKTIDKIILGIDDVEDIEKNSENSQYYDYVEHKEEEEFDVKRSIN